MTATALDMCYRDSRARQYTPCIPVLPPDATPAAPAPGCLLNEEGGDEGVPEAWLSGAPDVLASACSKTVVPNTTGGSGCPA